MVILVYRYELDIPKISKIKMDFYHLSHLNLKKIEILIPIYTNYKVLSKNILLVK